MRKENLEKQEFTTLEVIKAIERLDEKHRDSLLKNLKIDLITTVINSKESYDCAIQECEKEIERFSLMADSIRLLADTLMTPEEKVTDTVDKYISMNEEEKKDFCIKIYKDMEFQRNLCCEIMDNAKREIPEVMNVFKLFGVDLAEETKKILAMGK